MSTQFFFTILAILKFILLICFGKCNANLKVYSSDMEKCPFTLIVAKLLLKKLLFSPLFYLFIFTTFPKTPHNMIHISTHAYGSCINLFHTHFVMSIYNGIVSPSKNFLEQHPNQS